ncbi:MAG: GxxExxY protein [Thermodesulfovibrionales bacterium]
MKTDQIKHKDITEKILKGFYDVYNELNSGFLESVYESAMEIALTGQKLSVERQREVSVYFRGNNIGNYKADMIIDNMVIVGLKAAHHIDPVHEAQLINYLRATDIEIGLLLNFGRKPEFKRLIYENNRKCIREDPRKSAAHK